MRLIGTLSNENHARKIVSYLLSQGMESRLDAAFDVQTGHMAYHLWVLDEDRIAEASNVFEQFQSDSSNPLFDVPIAMPPAPPPEPLGTETEETEPFQQLRAAKTPLTTFLIALCISIFFLELS